MYFFCVFLLQNWGRGACGRLQAGRANDVFQSVAACVLASANAARNPVARSKGGELEEGGNLDFRADDRGGWGRCGGGERWDGGRRLARWKEVRDGWRRLARAELWAGGWRLAHGDWNELWGAGRKFEGWAGLGGTRLITAGAGTSRMNVASTSCSKSGSTSEAGSSCRKSATGAPSTRFRIAWETAL